MKSTFKNVSLIFAAGCLGGSAVGLANGPFHPGSGIIFRLCLGAGHGFLVETCQGERLMNLPKLAKLAELAQ